MDSIPLPPSGEPSYSPSQVTMSSPESARNPLPVEKVVPVLGKEKAKKRLLAFGKGISFGLKSRAIPLSSSKDKLVPYVEDEETYSSSSSASAPAKKMNIDAIMEEEKELAAARPNLSYIPSRPAASIVMPAVPQLIVPVLPPNAILPQIPRSSSPLPTAKASRSEAKKPKKHHSERRHKRAHDKFGDIADIPSNWASFKALGLLVSDPEFPKFKRQLDKEHDRLESIEARKKSNLNIVKSGEEFIWRDYLRDPVASECELAFRGLDLRIVQNYSKEGMQNLLWSLDSDYHSKEFPKDANKRTKGRHAVTYCYHPRFYPIHYQGRKALCQEEEEENGECLKLDIILDALFKTKKGDEEIQSSKFTSGSFVSKEVLSPIEHRQWFKKIDNFMNDKATVFPDVIKARQEDDYEPSLAHSWSVQLHVGSFYKNDDVPEGKEGSHEPECVEDKKHKSKKRSKKSLDENDETEPVSPKKSKKPSKKKKSKTDEEKVLLNNKTMESDPHSNSDEADESSWKKKKKKKKKKKSTIDSDIHQEVEDEMEEEEEEEEEVKSRHKKKKKSLKKQKKSKKSKKKLRKSKEDIDIHKTFSEKSAGLSSIGSWDDPMKLTEITISAHCDEDVRSPSPPPSSSSKGINVKDARTRSLFAVAGYGFEDDSSSKRKSSHSAGPRTPSPKSSSRGPRTPSPGSKSNWRPPSPRISPPRPQDGGNSPGHLNRKYRSRRSRSRSYDRCSSHSRSPSHHRRSHSYRRGSRSPRRPSHRHYGGSPSPVTHYSSTSYHLERSVADSTISDADLPGYSSNLRQIYTSSTYEDFHGNSPKRLSLDERLEKELGINVREVPPPTDFSVPPPGYPIRVMPLGRPPSFDHPPPPILPHMIPIVEPLHHPHSVTLHSRLPVKDVPEEGRLVRVGNMLQIVPEEASSSEPPPIMVPAPPSTIDKVAAAAAAVNAALLNVPPKEPLPAGPPISAAAPPANTAVSLMRKMEEMKRQRDKERESRKEQNRIQQIEEQESKEATKLPVALEKETPKVPPVEEPLTQQENSEGPPEHKEEEEEEEDEAKILQEAISSVPEMDEEEYVSTSPAQKTQSKLKKQERIHYISLKPFSKKERRRSKGNTVGSSCSIEDPEEEEEWVPRSPVPLPDASTCKPILLQLGFSGKEKKVLRYADGILPGQGSPDISDVDNPTSEATQASSTKKRKKIRLKIISQKDSTSESPPPPPPSSSPPLHHYSTWLSRQTALTS